VLRRNCLEYALGTRPVEERSGFYKVFGEKVDDDEEAEEENDEESKVSKEGAHEVKKNVSAVPPLLGRDEILQIKIIYGDHCSSASGQCSQVRNVVMPINIDTNNSSSAVDETTLSMNTAQDKTGSSIWNQIGFSNRNSGGNNEGVKAKANDVDVDWHSTIDYWKEPTYKFSTNEALMYLDDKLLAWHNVSIVNVTLSERCLSTGSDEGQYPSSIAKFAQFLSQIYGMDTLIINQLMYGIKTSEGGFQRGHLQNVETRERWAYSSAQLDEEEGIRHNVLTWWFQKLGILAISLVAFFLVTSVTALIVRLLTSSGVMIMFPIFAAIRSWGISGIDDRVLEYSYPWVGPARRAIRRQGIHPFEHYLFAHLAKLFLVYTMYESCQVAWSAFLYSKSTPANLPLWIFGNAMVYEYFSMVFVRSALR